MKKLFMFGILGTLFMGGCTEQTVQQEVDFNQKWSTFEEQAKGTEVNLYMWGGSDSINQYFDEWVIPRVEETYDITLNRVPVTDTKEILTQVLDEKTAGKNEGSIDIMWINGENFKTAKDNDLLGKPFSDKLPNVQNLIDLEVPQIASDFGIPVENLQAPWGTAQFVMTYDEARSDYPTSLAELEEYVQQNPGKFTYPALPDFTGSAFVRHVLYQEVGSEAFFEEPLMEREEVEELLEPVWSYLNDLEPYLWRQGETYPESLARLDQLFANGEVDFTMAYDPIKAAAEVQNGRFPESTRNFIWEEGTLSNTHYLAIPYNSPNPQGALVVINELLSAEAQAAKMDPANWGDLPVVELAKLSEEEQELFTAIDLGEATVPISEMEQNRLPEIPSIYLEWIEESWLEHVAQE